MGRYIVYKIAEMNSIDFRCTVSNNLRQKYYVKMLKIVTVKLKSQHSLREECRNEKSAWVKKEINSSYQEGAHSRMSGGILPLNSYD